MDKMAPSFYTEKEKEVVGKPFPPCERLSIDYAVMENGEGIFSVIPEQEINVNELLTSYGWDTLATYHLVATDAFYIPITPEDYDDGEIRGALSGAVNASFPEMTIAMGKISDVIFVEGIVE